MTIPKVFHRYWSGPAPMPGRYEDFGRRWLELHPGWELVTWTRKARGLLDDPQRLLYDVADRPQMASDVVRYEVLGRYGGVYLDCDVELARNIESLMEGVGCFAAWEGTEFLGTAVLGAAPGHPAVREAASLMPAWAADRRGGPSQVATGPYFLTHAWARRPDVTVFPPYSFYPYAYDEKHRAHESFPRSYGIHRWDDLWGAGDRTRMAAEVLPKGGRGVEVGVLDGAFADALLHACSPSALWLVDPWRHRPGYRDPLNAPDAEQSARHAGVVSRFSTRPEVKVVRAASPGAAGPFRGCLDWVYLDADHSYEAAKADLAAWGRALRPGGLLCGHDYVAPGPATAHFDCGVKRAVDELVAAGGWEWRALTAEAWPSYALRKL